MSLVGRVSAIVAATAVATTVTAIAAVSGSRPSGSGGNIFREAYLSTKEKFLEGCDHISHKYNIPKLCNCVAPPTSIYVTAGIMCVAPSGGPSWPGSSMPVENPQDVNPFDPVMPEDPFAPVAQDPFAPSPDEGEEER